MVGLLSCYTEQLRPLSEHLQATQDRQKTEDSPKGTPKARTRAAITPAEEAHFIKEYVEGKSTKEIARESGRSRSSISAVLKRSGVEMRSFREASIEDIRMMVYLYKSGLSLRRVAERVEFSERTVFNQLRKAGIQTRSTQEL